jgi:hypothetical protein
VSEALLTHERLAEASCPIALKVPAEARGHELTGYEMGQPEALSLNSRPVALRQGLAPCRNLTPDFPTEADQETAEAAGEHGAWLLLRCLCQGECIGCDSNEPISLFHLFRKGGDQRFSINAGTECVLCASDDLSHMEGLASRTEYVFCDTYLRRTFFCRLATSRCLAGELPNDGQLCLKKLLVELQKFFSVQ